jgi:kynurenine formamidase
VSMSEPNHIPTQDEVVEYLTGPRRNWGRWGENDQRGTINLITPDTRVAAARHVVSGRAVSLSRPLPTDAGPHNTQPVQHWWRRSAWKHGGGTTVDYLGLYCHGVTMTHLDALCHTWEEGGGYNGRPPEDIGFDGAHFGGIEQWADGIVARGVLLDVPRHRGVDYVTQDEPVHGWELESILRRRSIELQPGDAICVYSGRDAWQSANRDQPYGRWIGPSGEIERPGLHASCLPFLRDHDVSVLVWDMLDHWPDGYEVPFTIHATIYAYGLALLDNAQLEPLAKACAEEGRDDFMLVIAPLVAVGGTGTPVNPIALF